MKTNLNSDGQQFDQYLLVAYRTSSTKEKNTTTTNKNIDTKEKQKTPSWKKSRQKSIKFPGSGLEQPHKFVGV